MNVQEAKEILFDADSCGHVPLIVGVHGLGKSEIVRQYADENDMHCEVLILSLMDEGDLLGIPVREMHGKTPVTRWAIPSWLQRIVENAEQGKRSILFLDELNRASASVLGASLQLLLDKRLNEHVLPVDTFIVTAINPEDADYHVQSLDPAVLDRLVVCDVEADPVAWVRWAKKAVVNEKVVDFILKNPNKIHTTSGNGGKGTSPRSWTRLAKYLDFIEVNKRSLNTYYVKGSIGESLAAEFILFYNNYTKMLEAKDIIDNYKKSSKRHADLEKHIASMEKLIQPLEAIQKMDLAENLQAVVVPMLESTTLVTSTMPFTLKYKEGMDKKGIMAYLVYLYTLPIESLASYMKNLKASDNDLYMKLNALDGEVNNKGLIRRVVGV
ncbi:MAG: hypothetical protein FNT15_05585 [Sulfurovum sp.]|nr:MAG: hypothetical protein FNT15_05585 [Sulfurovum sp.]